VVVESGFAAFDPPRSKGDFMPDRPNTHFRLAAVGVFVLIIWTNAPAQTQDSPDSTAVTTPTVVPGITVFGQSEPMRVFRIDADDMAPTGPSAGDVLRWVPGAGVNGNGPLTPITQYRGLFGNRLNVLVDGVITNSACPNEMEPPLHYVSLPRLESLRLERGIASVSSGLETMGTTVEAKTRSLPYGHGREFSFVGDLSAFIRSADRGYSLGGLLGASNANHRFQAGASHDRGEDLRFGGGGKIAASAYRRFAWELGYGYRGDEHEIDVAYRRNETGTTGTPALPMDIRTVGSDIYRAAYDLIQSSGSLHSQIS
jgi:iron complex outermembrane receptor protein